MRTRVARHEGLTAEAVVAIAAELEPPDVDRTIRLDLCAPDPEAWSVHRVPFQRSVPQYAGRPRPGAQHACAAGEFGRDMRLHAGRMPGEGVTSVQVCRSVRASAARRHTHIRTAAAEHLEPNVPQGDLRDRRTGELIAFRSCSMAMRQATVRARFMSRSVGAMVELPRPATDEQIAAILTHHTGA